MVKVLEPLDTVNLTFDWNTGNKDTDGRLQFIKTHWPNYNGVEIDQIHKLYYGPYLNSMGNIEEVLLRVRESTNFGADVLENVEKTRKCTQCPVYDDLNKELEEALKEQEKQAGGGTT